MKLKFSYNGFLYDVIAHHDRWVVGVLNGVRDAAPTVIEKSRVNAWHKTPEPRSPLYEPPF